MSLVGFKARNHTQQVSKRGANPKVDDRATPPEIFDPLNERFGFNLDVCALPHNAKCERYFTPDDDGLDCCLLIWNRHAASPIYRKEPTMKTTDAALDQYLGKPVFVRTVTHHHTGRLVGYDKRFLVLDDAAWIADSGRWADALKTGTLNEVEPFPGCCLVAVGAVIDVCEWHHDLPRTQK